MTASLGFSHLWPLVELGLWEGGGGKMEQRKRSDAISGFGLTSPGQHRGQRV